MAGGVTTIYSPGEYDAEGTFRLKKKINLLQLEDPDILTAGPYFDYAPSQVPWINGVRSVNELESQFNLWKDKIDGIKVYTSITEEELEKIIELADQHNLPLPKQNRLLKEINDRGGTIVSGTDPVGPMITPGYGLHREMASLVAAGLTPMEAIQAATFNAAKALQKDAEFGSIEVGKQANLVVVQGNPYQNIINDIGSTVMIFKYGKQYDPDKLRESVLGKIGKESKD